MLLKLPCYKSVTDLVPLRKSALSKRGCVCGCKCECGIMLECYYKKCMNWINEYGNWFDRYGNWINKYGNWMDE